MILAIDIGNTTTNFGVFGKGTLASQFSIATQPNRTPAKRRAARGAESRAKRGNEIARVIQKQGIKISGTDEILICSVVPIMTNILAQALRRMEARRVKVIGQDIAVPLVNRYTYPEQVGQDRLVGAYAAWQAFGKGRGKDCIVADFGTAITIDLVTKRGEYLGGVIAPGLDISLEALATRTALLPKVELKEPPELLGRDTANSIRSGLLYGCVALCDGLVTQLRRRYAPKAIVVATGGASALIFKHASTIDYLKPHLVLEGLYQLSSICKNVR